MENWSAISAVAEIFSAMMATASALIAAIAIYKTVELARKQTLFEKRQLLLPLWEKLQGLNRIDPQSPVWIDVVRSVNILELIAACWESEIIDEKLVKQMYGELYLETYESIKECKNPPSNVGMNGHQMLRECPTAMRLYGQLKNEFAKNGKGT